MSASTIKSFYLIWLLRLFSVLAGTLNPILDGTDFFHNLKSCQNMARKKFKNRRYESSVAQKPMVRLNSGNGNRYYFFMWPIFIFSKSQNDSVNHADSGDTKILVQFPGNSILKFSLQF